jgi:hypothetical protein
MSEAPGKFSLLFFPKDYFVALDNWLEWSLLYDEISNLSGIEDIVKSNLLSSLDYFNSSSTC